jgi:hypothetical protein
MNMVFLLLSVAAVVGIFCRLNKLDIRQHKLSVILFNVGMLGAVGSVGEHAWIDALDVQDGCILMACLSWVIVSYKTWQSDVPEYVNK